MLVCPHCSKEIEVKEPKKEVSWWIYDGIGASRASGGGSLGCGTLILIAIIVAIIVAVFSGSNDNDIYTLSPFSWRRFIGRYPIRRNQAAECEDFG